ncbi:MAG: hypothetical protein QNJ34_12300 [Xenococcaceae cyanobacterium MO_188.B29]|nr:hypothetical protein [Xenococcaceae cyanobacterium MO_188.B29]
MKINSIFLKTFSLKCILGTAILIFHGVTTNNMAVASSLKFQENNSNSLEGMGNFSLKLNQNIYNQLEREILKQQADFSEYINLIDNGLNQNQYRFKVEDSILVQSPPEREDKLLEYFVSSLRRLEFESFSSNSSKPSSILVLPRVSYSDVYKDVYDFDVSLGNSSPQIQIKKSNRSFPRNTFTTRQPQEYKYFTSYFQANKNSDYLSFKTQTENVTYNSSSLLGSYQNKSLASLTSTSLIDLPKVNNQGGFPVLQQSFTGVSKQNYLEEIGTNYQLNNDLQAVYLPSTQIEIYQLNNINVPSNLSSYQKPKYQEELDKMMEKQRKKTEKQRERMTQKLAKLREQREKQRQKQQEKYRKERQKAMRKVRNEQAKLREQSQRQLAR